MEKRKSTINLPVQLWDQISVAARFMKLTKTSYIILALSDRLNKDFKTIQELSVHGKEIS